MVALGQFRIFFISGTVHAAMGLDAIRDLADSTEVARGDLLLQRGPGGGRGAPQGGAGYTFALPGNQAYNVLPGNLYLPAQNSGYTVTYQKTSLLEGTVLGESAPRPGGYAFTLPANQKIVINPGNLQLPGNAEGYSIIYANSA